MVRGDPYLLLIIDVMMPGNVHSFGQLTAARPCGAAGGGEPWSAGLPQLAAVLCR